MCAFIQLNAQSFQDSSIVSMLDAMNYFRKANPEKALSLGDTCWQKINSTNTDSSLIASWNYYYGSALLNSSSYSQAIPYILSASEYYRRHNQPIMVANSYLNMGVAHWNMVEYDQASTLYYNAIKIYEAEGDTVGVAICWNNLGNIYSDQRDRKLSLNAYHKAIQLYSDAGYPEMLDQPYNNIGTVYAGIGMHDSALFFYKKAHQIKQDYQRDDQLNLAISFNNLGSVYENLDSLELAEDYQMQALSLQKQVQDKRGMSYSYMELAQIYEKKGDFALAEEYYLKSIDISYQTKGYSERLTACDDLYALYKKQGKYLEALALADSIIELTQRVFDLKSTETVSNIQVQLKTAEKEKENIRLRAEKEIEASEKENLKKLSFIAVAFLVVVIYLIYRRYQIKSEANQKLANKNKALDEANKLVLEKNKEVTDSINYARKIQEALLPSQFEINQMSDDGAFLYLPRDIVSGDFYWVFKGEKHEVWVVGDCTGHGVPGALMSAIGLALWHDVVVKDQINEPKEMLNRINQLLIKRLNQSSHEDASKDGMDVGVLVKNLETSTYTFAGANMDLMIRNQEEVKRIKGVRAPIGYYYDQNNQFEQVELNIQKGDWLVLTTDGAFDQFGGAKNKKLKKSGLQEWIFAANQAKSKVVVGQLENQFVDWRKDLEQIDDVCLLVLQV